MIASGLINKIEGLRSDLERWTRELQEELGSSEVVGKATKAFNQFEVILRQLLGEYIAASGNGRKSILQKYAKGKSIDRLTLGEVVTCFAGLKGEFTEVCRERNALGATMPSNRELLDETELRTLRYISDLRKSLHSENMEATLAAKTPQLVAKMTEALAFPVFRPWQEK